MQVLKALVEAYPEAGAIVGVDLRRIWGDVIEVEVRTAPDRLTGRQPDPDMRRALSSAVKEAFPGERLSVRVLNI